MHEQQTPGFPVEVAINTSTTTAARAFIKIFPSAASYHASTPMQSFLLAMPACKSVSATFLATAPAPLQKGQARAHAGLESTTLSAHLAPVDG